jgi:PPOX class F420-dependent enzyme/OxyR family protein/uncharacterized protein (TIGR02246 family)
MPTAAIDTAHAQYLAERPLGRLATIAPNGAPQNKPVGFTYNPALATIDIAGIAMETSAKFRNVALHPEVALVVDDVTGSGPEGARFVEIRGRAERVELDDAPTPHVSRWIIRLQPRRLVSWNVEPGHQGMWSQDLASGEDAGQPARPSLALTGPAADGVRAAVARQVQELQEGLDGGDAEVYNRHFAGDVMWGSPYGATVDGYDELHAIHARLHAASGGVGASRYEIVRVLAPTPDVALAHVRRLAVDDDGTPLGFDDDRFAEMALYALVRRGGEWWLAAGQNTIIHAGKGAKDPSPPAR